VHDVVGVFRSVVTQIFGSVRAIETTCSLFARRQQLGGGRAATPDPAMPARDGSINAGGSSNIAAWRTRPRVA
jgi:hypothetical protein